MKHFDSGLSVQSYASIEAQGCHEEIQMGLHWHWMALRMLAVDPKVNEGLEI
jgi:hypothetical protein